MCEPNKQKVDSILLRVPTVEIVIYGSVDVYASALPARTDPSAILARVVNADITLGQVGLTVSAVRPLRINCVSVLPVTAVNVWLRVIIVPADRITAIRSLSSCCTPVRVPFAPVVASTAQATVLLLPPCLRL